MNFFPVVIIIIIIIVCVVIWNIICGMICVVCCVGRRSDVIFRICLFSRSFHVPQLPRAKSLRGQLGYFQLCYMEKKKKKKGKKKKKKEKLKKKKKKEKETKREFTSRSGIFSSVA